MLTIKLNYSVSTHPQPFPLPVKGAFLSLERERCPELDSGQIGSKKQKLECDGDS
jgi:hypothetical protein